MFQTKLVEKIEKHNLCSKTVFENRAVHEIMWKNVERGRQATDYMMHTHCMLDS